MKLLSFFCRDNPVSSQRWIKSLLDEFATNSTKEFSLPEGEGQGEGKPRSITQRRVISRQRYRAMILIEVMVVMAVSAILLLMILPGTVKRTHCTMQIACVNNLKEVGLSYRIWAGDHNDKFPMELSETNGGTMEFITGSGTFRHFQIMSNELSTPKEVFCPAEPDANRFRTTNFMDFGNSNISYFVGVDATQSNPAMILAGDHCLTNGMGIRNGILELTTKQPSGWVDEVHEHIGNILLADGSVQRVKTSGLRKLIKNTGAATNCLQMPIFGP